MNEDGHGPEPDKDHQIIVNNIDEDSYTRLNNNHKGIKNTLIVQVLSAIDTIQDVQSYTPFFLSNALEKVLDFLYMICPLSPPPFGYDDRHGNYNNAIRRASNRSVSYGHDSRLRTSDLLGQFVISEIRASLAEIQGESQLLELETGDDDSLGNSNHVAAKVTDTIDKLRTISQDLENVMSWQFDIIHLERVSEKRPLATCGMVIFPAFNTHTILNIDLDVLQNWLVLVEANYFRSNPYHNATHAADVVQATAYFLRTNCLSNLLNPMDSVVSLLAAAVHDIGHPGKTSAFLINIRHELAILYNDKAVLESHHSAFSYKLTLSDPRVNIFKNVDTDTFVKIRASVVDMVLSTEMLQHLTHVKNFRKTLEVFRNSPLDDLKTAENIMYTKRILIKCADVSNPARPLRISGEWVLRVCEEFFQQAEEEKRLGLPLTLPSFDRETCSVTNAQIGFNELFVQNLYGLWHEFLDIPEVMNDLQNNFNFWKKMERKHIRHIDEVKEYFAISKIGVASLFTIS